MQCSTSTQTHLNVLNSALALSIAQIGHLAEARQERANIMFFSLERGNFIVSAPTLILSGCAGAGAILSVGLFRHPNLTWAKMEKLFDVDGGVSGGRTLLLHALWCSLQPVHTALQVSASLFRLSCCIPQHSMCNPSGQCNLAQLIASDHPGISSTSTLWVWWPFKQSLGHAHTDIPHATLLISVTDISDRLCISR